MGAQHRTKTLLAARKRQTHVVKHEIYILHSDTTISIRGCDPQPKTANSITPPHSPHTPQAPRPLRANSIGRTGPSAHAHPSRGRGRSHAPVSGRRMVRCHSLRTVAQTRLRPALPPRDDSLRLWHSTIRSVR